MIRAASTRYALTLFSLFGVYWVALAIAPLHRNDWLLENRVTGATDYDYGLAALSILPHRDYRALAVHAVACAGLPLHLCTSSLRSLFGAVVRPHDEQPVWLATQSL